MARERAVVLAVVSLAVMLLALGGCRHKHSPLEARHPPTGAKTPGIAPRYGGQVDMIAQRQRSEDVRQYYVEAVRRGDGSLTLYFLEKSSTGVAAPSRLQTDDVIVYLAKRGKEGLSRARIVLAGEKELLPAVAAFKGKLPEELRDGDLTAVVPDLRLNHERLHFRLTLTSRLTARN